MASKSRKRGKQRPGSARAISATACIERNLEKGNFKQAVKDARVCFRQDPSTDHRRLLEFASIGRAQELRRQNDRDACRGVLRHLLDLAPREPAVQAGLPDLLLWAGLLDLLPAGQVAPAIEDEQWSCRIADQTVLQPDAAPTAMTEVRAGAARVRTALQSIYEGDHAAADSVLKDVARNSPFADWKLFVRGLAAYYELDSDRVRANWSRLDPNRVAALIARRLNVLEGTEKLDPTDLATRSALARIERDTQKSSLTYQLDLLQRQIDNQQMNLACGTLRALAPALRELGPELYERLVDRVSSQLIRQGRVSDLDRLAKTPSPLALDPHWNRSRALVREEDEDLEVEAHRQCWRRYIDDLSEVTTLRPAERTLAQALIWNHLASDHANEAEFWRRCPCARSHEDEIQEAVETAARCLEAGIRLAPTYAASYESLAELSTFQNQPQGAAEAYRRLLEQQPDHFDAALHLATYHMQQDAPLAARPYAERARRLKPLDRRITLLAWRTCTAAARILALRGEFDSARVAFQEAEALRPDQSSHFAVLGCRAILELKAGCTAASQQLVQQAIPQLVEPAPLWMLMMIEATRYQLRNEEAWFYEKRWIDALKRPCRGFTAGLMCALASEYLSTTAEAVPSSEQLQRLLKYVKRCTRVKWQLDDLRFTCQLLQTLDAREALRKFAKKGMKQFPNSAYFYSIDAALEIQRGPRHCRYSMARNRLTTAMSLTKQSNDPLDQDTEKIARQLLDQLDEMECQRPLAGRQFDELSDDPHLGGRIRQLIEEIQEDASRSGASSVSASEVWQALIALCQRLGLDVDEFLEEAAPSMDSEKR